MPRIYKGSETILKLLIDVPSTETIDKIKIALFTDNRSIAMEFFSDSITIYGNIAYLNAPEWTFMEMNDGIINYIAQGESNNKPFIFERQSNYILKSSDGFEMSEIMNGYYTKEETDVKLEAEQDKLVSGKTIKTINGESLLGSGNIAVATEQWVKNQDYATNSDVDEEVSDKVGQVNQRFYDYYTKSQVDELISNIDIPEGGEDGVYFLEETSYIHKYSYTETESGEVNVLYDYNENYYESDRLTNNIELYQAILNGKCKSVVYKTLNGYTTVLVSEDNGVKTYEQRAEYRCFPCQFEVVGNIVKEVAFSYVEKERVNFTTSPIYVKSMVLNSEGNFNSYATIDITDYYTKSEIDDKFANIDIPEGGSSEGGDKGVILEYPLTFETYTCTVNPDTGEYENYNYIRDSYTTERKGINTELYNKIINGEVTSVYLKYLYEIKEKYVSSTERSSEAMFTLIPLSFRIVSKVIYFESVFYHPDKTLHTLSFEMKTNGAVATNKWVDNIVENGSSDVPSGEGVYTFLYPNDYTVEGYDYEKGNTYYDEYPYLGSDRQAHNAEIAQKLENNEVKALYIQVPREFYTHYENDYYSKTEPIWMYVPCSYRNEKIVDSSNRITAVYVKGEDNPTSISTLGWMFYADGTGTWYEGDVPLGDNGESSGISEATRIIYLQQTEIGDKVMYSWDADSVFDHTQTPYVYTVVFGTDKGTQVIYAPLMGGRYENDNGFENYVYAFIGDEKWTWYFPNGAQEAEAMITPIGGGDSYTKEEIDSMIGDINNILKTI